MNWDIEEMLLYLRFGYLNTKRTQQAWSNGYICEADVHSVADRLEIPEETGRPKIERRSAMGLVENKTHAASDAERRFRVARQLLLAPVRRR